VKNLVPTRFLHRHVSRTDTFLAPDYALRFNSSTSGIDFTATDRNMSNENATDESLNACKSVDVAACTESDLRTEITSSLSDEFTPTSLTEQTYTWVTLNWLNEAKEAEDAAERGNEKEYVEEEFGDDAVEVNAEPKKNADNNANFSL
jgi:hypothetical protein